MTTDIPASITTPPTRSMLQTGQQFAGLNGMRSGVVANADCALDLSFAGTAPDGRERNWIQTIPGQGVMAVLGIDGPSEAWFDQTWRPGFGTTGNGTTPPPRVYPTQ